MSLDEEYSLLFFCAFACFRKTKNTGIDHRYTHTNGDLWRVSGLYDQLREPSQQFFNGRQWDGVQLESRGVEQIRKEHIHAS